ncbi:hypothetical protein AVEN_230804-1 [Araneus ventricosus]|uniref:Uncharacterized protein n=1 Tax=Araneus ventricosus TaxID=182803 RepID=A0A4Y2A247_ARAVE|nr:hypothetical protein AVEN_230804-1 [Araneus ventricosus]
MQLDLHTTARIHLRAERFANRLKTVRRKYFHEEPTVNHGKGASPLRTINHRLSVANGGEGGVLRKTPWFSDLIFLVRRRFAGNDELHLNSSQELPNPFCSLKKGRFRYSLTKPPSTPLAASVYAPLGCLSV